jgi:predicted ATPase
MTEELDRFHVILSGCSGGGKSTLLAELASRGYGTVAEPGRRIIAEHLVIKGRALPWIDLEAFARRAIEVSSNDMKSVDCASDWVFFDRGLIDAAAALGHLEKCRDVAAVG